MESQGRLLLRFEDDGDGTGKLLAKAASGASPARAALGSRSGSFKILPKPYVCFLFPKEIHLLRASYRAVGAGLGE
jgi:hypothetical protein